jgi:hypothetical protein
MVAIWVLVLGAAYAVSALFWRDDLSRSTIGAVALVLCAVTALAIFGAKGPTTLIGVVAAFGAVVAIGGGTVDLNALLDDGPPQEKAVVNCPPEPGGTSHNGFVAPTELGYAHIRSEPDLSGDILLRYPPGCELRLTGYCIGEPKNHWRFHVPDPIWFRAPGDFRSGYIASADVQGAPSPQQLPLESCPGGRPLPSTPEITDPLDRKISGPVEITAAAPNAFQVGFAVRYEDIAGTRTSASWHQIGVDVHTNDGIVVKWDTRSIPGQSDPIPASTIIVAVPCLGLESPYFDEGHVAAGVRRYVVANREGPVPEPLLLPPEVLDEAGEVACNNEAR